MLISVRVLMTLAARDFTSSLKRASGQAARRSRVCSASLHPKSLPTCWHHFSASGYSQSVKKTWAALYLEVGGSLKSLMREWMDWKREGAAGLGRVALRASLLAQGKLCTSTHHPAGTPEARMPPTCTAAHPSVGISTVHSPSQRG